MAKTGPSATRGVSITLVRRIASPATKVFRTWTDPRLMAKWLAPGADVVTSVTADVREGGRYRIEGLHAEGASYAISGTYLAVEAPRRVEMSWCYEGPVSGLKGAKSVVIAEFSALDAGSTELTLTHERNADSEAAEVNRVNWTLCIDKLDQVVETPDAAGAIDDDRRPEFFSGSQRDFQDRSPPASSRIGSKPSWSTTT